MKCLLGLLLSLCGVLPSFADDAFARITPSQAGYSAEKLDDLKTFLASKGSHSMLLLHDGKVFFEWGDIHQKLLIHSMRKAMLNSLYGIYVQQDKIRLDASLATLNIDDSVAELSAAEKQATVLHILKSRSGIYHDAAAESDAMTRHRPARGSHKPDEVFYYNNWDFNVAGHIFEQSSGLRIYDAFNALIAKPLGMQDYKNNIARVTVNSDATVMPAPALDGFYQYEPSRSNFPAYHFRLSAHDLALYGQLYLQGGQWRGQQLIPADWIKLSTKPYSITDADYGLAYGLLWDVLLPENEQEQASFFHTGVDVHMLGVYPKHKLVMVHRVNTEKEYRFNDGDLYRVIKMMHGARIK